MFKNKFWIALFVVGQAFSTGNTDTSLGHAVTDGTGQPSKDDTKPAKKNQSKLKPYGIFFIGAVFGYVWSLCFPEKEASAYYKNINAFKDEVGVVNGLAGASLGGMIIRIETLVQPNKNQKREITGNVGKVLEESVTVALGVLESNADKFGIDPKMFKSTINVHVSPGANRKDGPSAGITVFCSLLSAFTGFKIKHDVAMTGELTLSQTILPIGCIKEKLTAAKEVGIKKVLMPSDNRQEVEKYKKAAEGLEIVFVNKVTDILPHIFSKEDLKLLAEGKNRFSKSIAQDKSAKSKSSEVVNKEPKAEYMASK